MKKGTKILLTLGLLTGVSAIIYYYFKNKTDATVATPDVTVKNDAGKVITPTTPKSDVLQIGSKSDDVKYLQRALNKLGASLVVDGVFGQKTKDAVLLYAGTRFYPVTVANFNEILKNARLKQ